MKSVPRLMVPMLDLATGSSLHLNSQTAHPPFMVGKARYITVLKGTWWVATGPDADVYNPDKMTPVKAGSFIYEPAGGHHYDMAKDEEAVVEIIGMGPVATTSLEPGRGRQGRCSHALLRNWNSAAKK